MKPSLRKYRSGFTLVELMVSSAISVIVIMSLISTFIQQRKAYKAISFVDDMVQNARFATTQVSRDARMAGYGMNSVSATKISAWITWVSGVTNVLTMTGGSSGAPDTLRVVAAFDSPCAYLSASCAVGATTLQLQSGQGASFNTSSRKVLFLGKTETLRVTGVSGDTLTISRDPTVNGLGVRNAYPAGSQIELVKVVTYSWSSDTSTYPYSPHLRRDENIGAFSYDWQKMTAGNIEDFQVSLGAATNSFFLTARTSEQDLKYVHPTKGDHYRRVTLDTSFTVRQSKKK